MVLRVSLLPGPKRSFRPGELFQATVEVGISTKLLMHMKFQWIRRYEEFCLNSIKITLVMNLDMQTRVQRMPSSLIRLNLRQELMRLALHVRFSLFTSQLRP